MKCEDCEFLLEEYVDGELRGRDEAVVTAHLVTCASCAARVGELRREQEIYSKYAREIELTPAVWARVRTRISEANQRPATAARMRAWLRGLADAPRLSPALVAMLIVLAVGLTIAVTTFLSSRNGPTQVATENQREPAPSSTPGGITQPPERQSVETAQDLTNKGENEKRRVSYRPPTTVVALTKEQSAQQLIREAEQKYLAAISILSRDFTKKRSTMDPAVLVKFDDALRGIDSHIAATRAAYRSNPQDPIALQYLLAAYSKKVEVLREVTLN